MKRKRLGAVLPALVALLLVLASPRGVWASEVPRGREAQWRQQVQATGRAPLERNTRASLRRALEGLQRGPFRLAVKSLQAKAGRAFFDASRVHEARLLEDVLRLVEETRAAWLSGQVTEPRALAATEELLLALRQAAEVALEDARLLGAQRPGWLKPAAWEASRAALEQAEEAWRQAQRQWEVGEARPVGQHLLATWRHATEALHAVGVDFRRGTLTDVDRDGVPDALEVRLGSSPLSADTDGDGLSDAFEARWGGAHLQPSLRDTDGDGVPDGDEDTDKDGLTSLQEQARRSDPLRPPPPRSAPTARRPSSAMGAGSARRFLHAAPRERATPASGDSAPWGADSDGDGLEDEAERFHGTPPHLADGDGDGLNDAEELAHTTEPGEADTDGDGFTDGEEVAHLADGFDPLVPDERMTPGEWARDYSDGLLLGDTCDTLFSGWKPCKGNVPFFLGQLSGGAASFIPVAGWVVGTVGDVRDTLGNVVKGDWVGAGLSVVGLLPYVGDVGTLAGKVAAFTARHGKLEPVLRAVLLRLPGMLAAGPRARWLPSADAATLGPAARKLVLEVLRKLDPKGFSQLRRYGGEEFLTRLAAWGARWEDLALLFHRLEASGLFTQYPRMKGFLEEMIRTTPDEVLHGGGHLLSLQGRVTLNLKKAALRLRNGPPKYLETVRNHLRAALAEHSTLARFHSDEEIIRLGHITANGVDRVFRHGDVIHVLEVKAASKLGLDNLRNWLRKTVDPTGKAVYVFNGNRLSEYLRRAGHSNMDRLLEGRQLHFNLFVYDANPHLTEELLELFRSGSRKILVDGVNEFEITLVLTKHWN